VSTLSSPHLNFFELTITKSNSEKTEAENWGALLMSHGFFGRLVSRETSSFENFFMLTKTKYSSEKSETENWGALLMRHGFFGWLVSRETSSFENCPYQNQIQPKTENRGALFMMYQDWWLSEETKPVGKHTLCQKNHTAAPDSPYDIKLKILGKVSMMCFRVSEPRSKIIDFNEELALNPYIMITARTEITCQIY